MPNEQINPIEIVSSDLYYVVNSLKRVERRNMQRSPRHFVYFPFCWNKLVKKCFLCSEGGAAITYKDELEKINEENLHIVSSQLRQAMISGRSLSEKVHGMDWSKRHGESEVSFTIDDIGEYAIGDSDRFVVVHGAG